MSAAEPLIEAELSSYGDLAQVIRDLPVIVRSARRMRRLSLRAAGVEMGLSFATVHRVESGHDFDSGTLQALLRWLDEPVPAPTTDAAVRKSLAAAARRSAEAHEPATGTKGQPDV